ncbi:putative cytochrome c oxidase assembly protein [Erysiphe neolycopersici]|uniref:Putative cytochrome c oxidase assembly protein n=1 Tax=Erysiphe neolycopersici TaxID=212602 RepID=A0A420HSF4_9PEZI|nr:putative cytochrome c oxidase assembly protein [Erysiphe neolycopersici]
MSLASKLTLAGTSLFALSTVIFVHYAQKAEKAAMHQGVIRDLESQRLKKERQQDFEIQSALETEYRKIQHVVTQNNDDHESTK